MAPRLTSASISILLCLVAAPVGAAIPDSSAFRHLMWRPGVDLAWPYPGAPVRDRLDPRAPAWRSDPTAYSSRTWKPGDQYWWDGFDLPQVNGYVLCAAEYDGRLIIGGSFSRIGLVDAHNIAAWDGANWTEFGGGVDSRVEALHVFEGDLIIGGYFSHAGRVSARGVARWDGTQWHPLGLGLGDPPYDPVYGSPGARAFTTYQGTLIACGWFVRAGGHSLPYLARWSGSGWSAVSDSITDPVLDVEAVEDTLYIGGYFQGVGSLISPGIARWDGSSWSGLGGGLSNGYGTPQVGLLQKWGEKIVASGDFTSADSIEVYGLAAWNGSSWESLGRAYYGPAVSMLVEDNTLLASFWGYIGKWSGSGWPEYAPGLSGGAQCLALYQSDLFAGGDLWVRDSQGNLTAFGTAIHSGGRWTGMVPWNDNMHGLTSGTNVYVNELTTYRDQLVAFGNFYFAGSPPNWVEIRRIASWNGTSWTQLPLPAPYAYGWWSGAMADHDSLYLVGLYQSQSGSVHPVIRFDGTTWAALDSLWVEASDIALYQGELYIAGVPLYPREPRAEVHRLRNGRWELVGSADASDPWYQAIEAMAVHDGKLYVGGLFDGISGVVSRRVAAWNGSTWEEHGLPRLPVEQRIRALASHGGALVATGNMPEGSSVLQLREGTWTALGQLYAYGTSLVSVGDELYLGGRIWSAGHGSFTEGVMRWNGKEWSSLGSGVNSDVHDLQVWNGSLYLGGSFTRAGPHGSFGVARWTGLSSTPGAPRLTLASGAPNPFRVSSAFQYRLSRAGGVRISVHDVRGREVRLIEEGERGAGDHTIVWDGRMRSGAPASSGVYYVRVRLPDGSERSQKAVLLR